MSRNLREQHALNQNLLTAIIGFSRKYHLAQAMQ